MSTLYEQINKQKAKISTLNEQNNKLTAALEKKTRQLELSKRTAYLSKPGTARKENTMNNVSEIDIVPAPNPRQSSSAMPAKKSPTHNDALAESNLIEVARNYKAR